ncbi:AMP-binding protein [Cupriavidus consociatus]|uniref:AMP-binding protein n=1 Tax=Cupriavidus consociatus TaxID=2821357 RepID=UPI001AEB28AD|nr:MULTISPECIES: AMP-binding protein [unclassified Cupriavidus]MBP0624103.1 AMP-binding protein [Cupriavidus sp. LEh25]MDK2660813.1 AMP-binding protein [Cupriavidus sp. LEh21]
MNPGYFPLAQPHSVIETLAAWRERIPDQHALTILRDGEDVECMATFRQLHDATQTIASGLRARCPRGTRVILLLPTSMAFVGTFFGCLAAGMVAVPAFQPQQTRKVVQWRKLQAIVDSSRATLIVAPDKSLATLAGLQATEGLFQGCEFETYDGLLAAGEGQRRETTVLPSTDDLAFLQYTSGSTGTPKGVMITHGNILDNQRVIAALMGHTQHSRVLSWLPLYHDMGLSVVLQMASVGSCAMLMSPVDFAQQPLRWLRAISTHRAHTSGGPNFAYQMTAAALDALTPEDAALDLSSWDMAFCGAEPIHPDTIVLFQQAARRHGFAAQAFYPCYGMAEATLMVTGGAKGGGARYLDVGTRQLAEGRIERVAADDQDGRRLVSCGGPGLGVDIRIVTAAGLPVANASQIGEIWVRGQSIGSGYFNNAAATDATFRATLPGWGDDARGYLRTGDLGALIDGELYVTGRVKDMLILRGRNIYPQDVEACVQDGVPDLRRGYGAAVSVPAGDEEGLVIIQEVGRRLRRGLDAGETARQIVMAVNEEFGVTPHAVVLVEPGSIEKTSSGKIARTLCRRAYLQGELRVVATWTEGRLAGQTGLADVMAVTPALAVGLDADAAPASAAALKQEAERRIVRIVAAFTKTDEARVSRKTPWAEMGFDSMIALQLALKLRESTGLALDAAMLWEFPDIDALANYLAGMEGAAQALAVGAGEAAASAAAPRAQALPAVSRVGGHTAGERTEADVMALSDAEAEALLLNELER